MDRKLSPKSSHLQLVFLGIVSLTVGIVCMLVVVFVYHLPAITSISESATTGNRAGMIVPFALGCMFTYGIAHVGYCKAERILTRVMAVGFLVVAMQICKSEHIEFDRVGLLGLPVAVSHVVHVIGSIVGFGAMFIWIAFFFTRGVANPTPQKLIRNEIYLICATLMAAGIVVFVLGSFGVLGNYSVYIAEQFMLIPMGFALIVKSGYLVRDR